VSVISLLGQHAVHRCSTHPKHARDGARGLTTRVHPLCQANFRLVEHGGSSDVLTTCPARLTGGCAAFATKLKFKLGEASF
jgi:hypothetical protein